MYSTRGVKCLVAGFLVFLLFLIPLAHAGQTSVEVSINSQESAEITDFKIYPTPAYRYKNIHFSITMENTGNLLTNIQPKVEIYLRGSIVDNITLESSTLPVGGNVTITGSWNTGNNPNGNYTAVAKGQYNNTTSIQTGYFHIKSRSGGGSVSGTSPFHEEKSETEESETNIEENSLSFFKTPVLIELTSEETHLFDMGVKNLKNISVSNLKVNADGPEWMDVSTSPSTIDLDPNSSATFSVYVTVQNTSSSGDYKVEVSLNNTNITIENFFIIRVNPQSPSDLPLVNRNVDIDRDDETIEVNLRVVNRGPYLEKFEVVEEIPKSLASDINQVYFENPPMEILETDPVVKWVLEDVSHGEVREIQYKIKGEPEELSPAIYWPVKQTNAYYSQTDRSVKIASKADILKPGEKGYLSLTFENFETKPIGLAAKIGSPVGWHVSPSKLTTGIPAGASDNLTFFVTPPSNVERGTYYLKVKLSYKNTETVDFIPVQVKPLNPPKSTNVVIKKTESKIPHQWAYVITGLLLTVIALQLLSLTHQFKDAKRNNYIKVSNLLEELKRLKSGETKKTVKNSIDTYKEVEEIKRYK